MAIKSKWTLLTYISAHNNLDELGKRSLLEILKVGSTSDVVHGVLYDGHAGAARYVMGAPDTVQRQEQLGSFDSGDPDGLIATAKWLFEAHPAERYGIVLWSHGTGWEPEEIEAVAQEARPGAMVDPLESRERAAAPGSYALFRSTLREILKPDNPAERAILFDDGTGHSLDTLELARVVDRIADFVGQPLDLLGMDACLMGNLEVAYEVSKGARYLVASQELVPGHSWPYDQIYSALRANPDTLPHDLAKRVVEDYTSYYFKHPPAAGDVTKVALDLSKISALSTAVGHLAQALIADMQSQANVLWSAQHGAMQQESQSGKRKANKFQFSLWDLGSLSTRIASQYEATPAVRQAASETAGALRPGGTVLAEGHYGAWFDGTGGVSIYLVPPSASRLISPYYKNLAFAQTTQWDTMVRSYFDALV